MDCRRACCSGGGKRWQTEKKRGLESGEDVVPASQLRQAEARIRELERMLGKKTMENEILTEAVRIAREKTHLARKVAKTERWKMSPIARMLGVDRKSVTARASRRAPQRRTGDAELVQAIEAVVGEKPSFGYRRVAARLRQRGRQVNHKRIYRLMKRAGLLLQRYAPRPERLHDVKVITLKSDLRWCSDAFEIRCWSG